jgi:MEMO1 family protein
MRRVFGIILIIAGTMNSFAQNISADRNPAVAGSFYPADKETLMVNLKELFSDCVKTNSDLKVRALISPHAGYVFSGKIAASAFASIKNPEVYKNIFIIGSSHVMAFPGASIYNTGDFITPLGKVKVNTEIANKLKENKVFDYPVTAHLREHSIEVQLPFIQYIFKNGISIIPIIIGTDNTSTISRIADALKPYFIPENLFVISSDFSHYPSYNNAVDVDRRTADAIISKKSDTFLRTLGNNDSQDIKNLATSMCGWTSGLTLLYLAEKDPNLVFKKICYNNSGDSRYGNKDEVVGYNAIILEEKVKNIKSPSISDEVRFTKEESQKLIAIARNSIKSLLYEKKALKIDPETLPAIFRRNLGAFVTLKLNGALRGCIGRFNPPDPLYEVVSQMAAASAFEDNRFGPLSKEEFSKIEIEISVLSPLRRVGSEKEIILGKHGIYIKKGFLSGTMLPQVATENRWTLEEFLGYTSRDKAGLGWNGWKDAELYVYEAVILEEK